MANTGIKRVLTLRKYIDGVATNETKENIVGDPDYIAPYEDLVDCPIAVDATPTATPTVTPTATPTPTPTPSGLITTCHDVTYDSSLFSLDMDVYGIGYSDHTGTFTVTSFNDLGFSIENGSEFTYNVCAESISSNIFSTSDNQSYPQYDSALSISNSGTACSSQNDCAGFEPI